MQVGDAIRIVRGDEDLDFCTNDSWYIHDHKRRTLKEVNYCYPGPTYYRYKDYENSCGVILKIKRNTIWNFDFYIVLIGNKKIMCLEAVMEKISI